jgi:hypothetical protein
MFFMGNDRVDICSWGIYLTILLYPQNGERIIGGRN